MSVEFPEYASCNNDYYGQIDCVICDGYTITHEPTNTKLSSPADVFAMYSECDYDADILRFRLMAMKNV